MPRFFTTPRYWCSCLVVLKRSETRRVPRLLASKRRKRRHWGGRKWRFAKGLGNNNNNNNSSGPDASTSLVKHSCFFVFFSVLAFDHSPESQGSLSKREQRRNQLCLTCGTHNLEDTFLKHSSDCTSKTRYGETSSSQHRAS